MTDPYAPREGQPYQQPPGGRAVGSQPGYGAPGRPARNGLGIAALVLGLGALLLCWTILGGIVLGLLAVVLGFIGRGRARRGEATNGGLAITGLVLGLVGLLISVALLVIGIAVFNSDDFGNLQDCLEAAGQEQSQVDECNQQFADDLQS